MNFYEIRLLPSGITHYTFHSSIMFNMYDETQWYVNLNHLAVPYPMGRLTLPIIRLSVGEYRIDEVSNLATIKAIRTENEHYNFHNPNTYPSNFSRIRFILE